MQTEIHLEKQDIIEIIAKRFGVNPSTVDIRVFANTVGYGMGEHDEPTVTAVIKTGEINELRMWEVMPHDLR